MSKDIRAKVRRSLSRRDSFAAHTKENGKLDRDSFSKIMMEQEDEGEKLTRRESAMFFSNLDHNGQGEITLADLDIFVDNSKNILKVLENFSNNLEELKKAIKEKDGALLLHSV